MSGAEIVNKVWNYAHVLPSERHLSAPLSVINEACRAYR